MIWPTKKEYNIAIENWRTTLSNPDLRKGQLARNKHGKIFPLGGANHYVTLYKFDNQDKTHSWVVRCFCTKRNEQNPFEIIDQPPDDIKARYKTLHDFCRSDTGKKISALVRVDYLENEITVGEWKYPIAKMDFLSALNLGEFIAENYQDRATMQQLGEAWKRMMCELEEVRIAHGDLDLTNVLVERQASALRLRLIDYDSFWVPSLGNSDQPVYGHQSFQHPGFFRIKKRPDNAEMDRFSALVIYLSIAMLTLRPELYFKCGANEVDRLLFSPEDYEQPDGGRIMEFRRLSLPGTHKYIDELRMALHNNLMPRPLSVIGGREPTSNQLYTPQPPTLDWDKLILNPRVAPYSPSTQPANPLPSPTPKPKGASQTSIINFLVDLVIFQLISLLLIAIGFGVFFLLKAIGVIATLPKMHNFSGTQYILAAFVALFSFSGNSPTIRSMLENLALPSLDYLVLIALVSNLISLILYILVRRRIHSMVHSQSPQYESPKQSPELLQYSTRATLIEPSWAADISQPSHQEEVLASGSQFVEFSPSIDPVISQPESTFLHDNHTEPEHLSQHTIQQSSLQIREGGIEIRLKEACSQLAQGKSDSVIKLAIEIQLSYYEFWAKLMDAVANTSTEYMNVNTRRWASQMLKDGNTAPDTNKALKCYTTALVLYRWMLNSIRKRTLDSADIWCYMGIAYYHLPAEDLYSRNANLRAAIACYQIALYVYTDNNILEKRARINRYLGDAYMEMLEEDWATNLEAAMACYEIARLYCPEGVPEGAKTDQRLGRAYYTFATHSLSKNERKESLDKALSQYEAALHVCKPRTEIWATVQYELGLVHNCLNQPQEATKCYDRALEVYTEHNSPRKHAETSYRKGIAHVMLFHQTQHQSCLREAQLCYSNALSTYNKLKLIDEVKSVRESIEQLQKIRL